MKNEEQQINGVSSLLFIPLPLSLPHPIPHLHPHPHPHPHPLSSYHSLTHLSVTEIGHTSTNKCTRD